MRKLIALCCVIILLGALVLGCAEKNELENLGEVIQEQEVQQDKISEESTIENNTANDDVIQESDAPQESDIEKTEQEKAYAILDEYNFSEEMPGLSIMYDDKMVKAVTGAHTWNINYGNYGVSLEGISESPEKLVGFQEKAITIDEDTEIRLVFSRPYVSYKVEIWNAKDYDLSQEIDVYGGRIGTAKEQPRTIYAVTAKFEFISGDFKESGTVHYAFVVN